MCLGVPANSLRQKPNCGSMNLEQTQKVHNLFLIWGPGLGGGGGSIATMINLRKAKDECGVVGAFIGLINNNGTVTCAKLQSAILGTFIFTVSVSQVLLARGLPILMSCYFNK